MRFGIGSFSQGRAVQRTKRTGVSNADALRMARRAEPQAFGIDESMFPESAPDPEEAIRRNRRKFLAQMRRRSGRMSTILTGGASEGGYGL